MAIKAPFNFVKLSSKVYFPEWSNQITHDIPFSDGISGTIDISITSKSPIFVRNGHTKEDAEANNINYKSFSNVNGDKYFIPSTTVKGTIRNVLEILSFSKIGQFKNLSFGIRDLSNNADGIFYREKIKKERIHCGWLSKKSNDKYEIKDCGLPWRISLETIDNKFGTELEDFALHGDFTKDNNKTASKKYDLFGENNLENKFFSDEDLRKALSVGNRQFVKFDSYGEDGIIVFTGQSGRRQQSNSTNRNGQRKWKGKFFEFVFPKRVEKDNIEIERSVIEDFKSIHKDSPDYANFRKKDLENNKPIPVFFQYDNDNNIESIGLAYMYKYPAYNSIADAIEDEHLRKEEKDLSECIFGNTGNKSYRGRVQFSNAFINNNVIPLTEQEISLSSPHPSYYPLYLGNGRTWNSENAKIAGRKRYIIRNNITLQAQQGTDAMRSPIIPLPSNSIFKGKIKFHNLRPIELGSLLSAISFHNNTDCYHNIGQGKPLGYGKSKISIDNLETNSSYSINDLLNIFEKEMINFKSDWVQSSELKELFAMAKGVPVGRDNEFTYMTMSTNRGANEFLTGKTEYSQGKQLGYFTEILSNNVPTCAFCANVASDLARINKLKIEEERQRRENELNEKLNEAFVLYDNGKYLECKKSLDDIKNNFLSQNVRFEELNNSVTEKIEEQRLLFNQLKEKGDTKLKSKEFKEAKNIYKQANLLNFENLSYEIQKCETELQKIDKLRNSNITDFVKFSSIGACAGNLKKWKNENGEISNDDCKALGVKLKSELEKMETGEKKKNKKKWIDFKNWEPIIKELGKDKSLTIFEAIKNS